jgi:PAS domain S-box-containing protein
MTISRFDAPDPTWRPDFAVAHVGHAVQFYETDEFLARVVGEFLAEGLAAGDAVIVVATPAHRAAFAAELTVRGFDVAKLDDGARLTFLDAGDALATFMSGGFPDEQKFRSSIGGILAFHAATNSRLRVYGEMVDVLWRDGKPEAAIRLEEMWNDLATVHTFSLLCAYPMGNFYKESHSDHFEQICRTHGQVIPTETVAVAEADGRGREIALLQQRAQALEAELDYRRQLEHALRDALSARRRAERDLKDFVENATIGLHWVGPDGTILWANDAELRLVGYEEAEYVGRNIADFHVDRATIDDILRRLSANEEIHEYEARLRAKDGSIKTVAISSNVLFENGEFVHTRCFTRDITDRKRLEDERAFLLDATAILNRTLDFEERIRELAELIVPRIADWCSVDVIRDDGTRDRASVPDAGELTLPTGAEASVIDDVPANALGIRSCLTAPITVGARVFGSLTVGVQGQGRYSLADLPLVIELARRAGIAIENSRLFRLAHEGNRAKDEFLATLSHEIRTPLTAILGWSRMLRSGGLDETTTRTALETIERSAQMQAALIDDIFDLSKVVTGKVTLERQLVDLGGIIDSAIETVQLAANSRGVLIDFKRAARPVFVTGDATRLRQVIWNLLSNAIKFSSPNGVIKLDLDTATTFAKAIVRDEGVGIRRDFLPFVFEPFRQAESATTRTYGGLGLGLAIVKYFTELHGGHVTAESAGEGQGATFTVTLPLAT